MSDLTHAQSQQLHAASVVHELELLGERTQDENGHYVALTPRRLTELLQELRQHRESAAKLNDWLELHITHRTSDDPVIAVLAVLELARNAVSALMPVVTTIWGNIRAVAQAAGIKLQG